jgi:DNA-binding MarR family transcriptional regulator
MMKSIDRTRSGEALSLMVMDLFRVSSLLLICGDRLVASLGLTSARWQVLGAIVAAERPQPIAWLARDLGGNRQNIQRIVNDLNKDGLVSFEANPHHRRAQLVLLTAKGKQAFEAAMQLQAPWINDLADGLSEREIEKSRRLLVSLRKKLEASVLLQERG